jgi:hypothetical protein
MVGWNLVARRTRSGIVGTVHYVDDNYTEDLQADVSGEAVPCEGAPGAMTFERRAGPT